MSEPASLRVVRIVAQWLADDPELPDEVPIDLRDFSNDIADVKKPALFCIITNTDLGLARESELGMVDPLGITLVGYVKADPNELPPPVTETRERFLQAVVNRIGYTAPDGDSLVRRLRLDRAAVGAGGESFQQYRPAFRGDHGERPPWGSFEVPCYAMLHYTEGAF
jgi:hypothetical protein